MSVFVNVEGTLASGKTTLVEKLSDTYDIFPIFEPVQDNPFLDRFYEDNKAYAFKMQMWLLSRRHASNKAASWLARAGRDVAVDRGRDGDRVFCLVNHEIGNIDKDELDVYDSFYDSFAVRDPDYIVYLEVPLSVVRDRIVERGRGCEQEISDEYIEMIIEGHKKMIKAAENRGVEIIKNPSIEDIGAICRLKKKTVYFKD